MRERMPPCPPEPEMLHRLGILVNRIPAIPLPEQPVGILKENYSKTVGRHPAASPFATK